MRCPVEELGSEWPLYLIGEDGVPEQLGRLHFLLGGKFWLERGTSRWASIFNEAFADNVFPDLPWFLDDYRPQGFLGRAFARKHAEALGQQPNPEGWSGRVVLEAMLRFGGDFPGAFVLGRESLAAAMAAIQTLVGHAEREVQYPDLAERALRGDLVGSSAGGEQPKFIVDTLHSDGVRHFVVKFSPPMGGAMGRRWADLLFAEHIAGTVLAENGFTVAHSNIVDAGARRFLEVERFDRAPGGGRMPLVSLRTMLAAILDGIGVPWPDVSVLLLENGWLTPADASQLASAWNFGKLISNTDMHDGNASLVFTAEKPVRLAPIYDMLPMAYRPGSQGEVLGISRVEVAIASAAAPSRERDMAESFWEQLSTSQMVSKEFREIADHHATALCTARKSGGRRHVKK
jgi:hypothetical protein